MPDSLNDKMKRRNYQQRIDEIVNRLSELSEMDKRIVQPSSSAPVVIDVKELFAYGERYEERQRLHDELRALAQEPIED